MNFKVESLTEFRTDVQLLNTKTHKPVSEKLKLIYLQLPYFTKEEKECKTDFERWIYIFKNMEILERIPWTAKNSIFAKLGEIAEVANLSKLQRRKYDQDLKIYRDSVNILKYAKEEGFTMGEEKGRAEGIAEGAHQEKIATARKMKAENMPLDLIARITNLPISEIEN
ncbi:MAG: PD-(D/E)XK nuclease family transposase, partial [Bacteroidales bacterium]|nr:PD-(D/E)XK nuclease family transposase [Bacteroidales bacterium]